MLKSLLLLAINPSTAFVAQIAGGDAPTPLTSLVFGALGSSPATLILAWVVTRGDKEKAELRAAVEKKDDEIRRLNELRPEAAKEMATLLEHAAATLRDVKDGMDATLTKSRPDELNRTLRELRELIEERPRREGRGT